MINRRTLIVGSAGFMLASCANNTPTLPVVPTQPPAPAGTIDLTKQKGWQFMYGSAQPPFRNGLTFDIPSQGDIHYLLCSLRTNIAQKQAYSFEVDITSSPDVAYVPSDPGETAPCFFSAILGQLGDNLATDGYRWFSRKFPLQPGSSQVVLPLTTDNWTGIYGEQATAANGFGATLSKLAYVGITFGGCYFAGHGIRVAQGSSTFTIKSAVIA